MAYLTALPIEPSVLLAEVAGDGCGASVLFLGTVRASLEDGPVTGIDYSAYPEMAEAEFAAIVREVGRRWPGARVTLRHRTGWVATGEVSIGVAVAAAHRAEAYEASRYVIEETKKRVPLWKREHLASGDARWVGAAGA